MRMYVSEVCAEGIFATFLWWIKNVKSRPKTTLFFQMSTILKFAFQKRKQLRFSEVKYLNYTKKDPILHVTATIFLSQGKQEQAADPFHTP